MIYWVQVFIYCGIVVFYLAHFMNSETQANKTNVDKSLMMPP